MPMRWWRQIRLASCCLPLVLAATALGQSKIGFVNANVILEQAPQAVLALEKLEQEFASRDQELIAQREAITALDRQLNQLGITEADQRADLERQIRQAQRELARMEEDFRDDFNVRRNQELQTLQTLIQQVITSVRQDENFTIILNQDAVASASKEADITPLVLQRLADLAE